jgi:hypothetical protein
MGEKLIGHESTALRNSPVSHGGWAQGVCRSARYGHVDERIAPLRVVIVASLKVNAVVIEQG